MKLSALLVLIFYSSNCFGASTYGFSALRRRQLNSNDLKSYLPPEVSDDSGLDPVDEKPSLNVEAPFDSSGFSNEDGSSSDEVKNEGPRKEENEVLDDDDEEDYLSPGPGKAATTQKPSIHDGIHQIVNQFVQIVVDHKREFHRLLGQLFTTFANQTSSKSSSLYHTHSSSWSGARKKRSPKGKKHRHSKEQADCEVPQELRDLNSILQQDDGEENDEPRGGLSGSRERGMMKGMTKKRGPKPKKHHKHPASIDVERPERCLERKGKRPCRPTSTTTQVAPRSEAIPSMQSSTQSTTMSTTSLFTSSTKATTTMSTMNLNPSTSTSRTTTITTPSTSQKSSTSSSTSDRTTASTTLPPTPSTTDGKIQPGPSDPPQRP
jgi:hypothetical protein